MKNFLAPAELTKYFIGVGITKANNSFFQLLLLGILAGVYVGFAAHFATVVGTGWVMNGEPILFGLKKLLMGVVFTVGLMMVIIPGSELFTGNMLMTIALCNKEITFIKMLRNWGIIYLGNFIGSLLLAIMIASLSGLNDGAVGATAISIAHDKLMDGGQNHNLMFFIRGIGCNWLVCLAVMMAAAAQDITGKIFACFFPVMAFVASSFEHSVANMYFIPAGIFSKGCEKAVELSHKTPEMLSNLNWENFVSNNLIAVTLGNIVGGGVFVGMAYWILYIRNSEKKIEKENEIANKA